jgi:hypothetical protein
MQKASRLINGHRGKTRSRAQRRFSNAWNRREAMVGECAEVSTLSKRGADRGLIRLADECLEASLRLLSANTGAIDVPNLLP